MNGRERVLALAAGQPTDRLAVMPVVMMFCADHIGVPYGRYVEDHRVLVEAQVRTAQAFDFDVVSNMSDPAREAADSGAHVRFFDDQPAAIVESDALLADKTSFARLTMPDPLAGQRMRSAVESIRLMREEVGDDKAVMGWVEGPYAEAADLRGLSAIMLDLYDDPGFVHEVSEFVVELALRYARAQVDAGADIIGIGDAAASLIGPQLYDEFVWPHEKRLVDGLQAMGAIVRLHVCGNTSALVQSMGRLGCEIVDLDHFTDLGVAREAMGPDQVLLGNIDPVEALRNSTPEAVTAAVARCHEQAGERFVVGAGCEVPRDTPAENVRAMVDYARTTSA